MARLRGRGLSTGMALGTAAVVQLRKGLPIPPPIPPRIAMQLARRREDETPDIILVAEDYQTAAAIAASLRWANVVGIAAVTAPPDVAMPLLPVVVDLPGLLEKVQDDMLIVVDADRGLVVADPDGFAVAQYQSERNNLAPKRRLYLDEGHLPAQTMDGRTVQVLARVTTRDDITVALDSGADALFVPTGTELLPEETEEEDQQSQLLQLAQAAAGKPLLLADNYDLSATGLLEAAVKADIMVVCPLMPHLEGQGVGELGQELNEARADLLACDRACDMPRLAVEIPALQTLPLDDPEQAAFYMDRLAYNGAARLFLSLEDERIDTDLLGWVDSVVASANTAMLPVIAHWIIWFYNFDGNASLSDSAIETLQRLVGAGVSGLVVTAGEVGKVKSALRELNFSECREALSSLLNPGKVQEA